jgi:adenine-specific DNA-methyltransferase
MRVKMRSRFGNANDVTLFHGDCLKLLRTIPDGAAQLVVTSPPYNMRKEYERRQTLNQYLDFQNLVINECVRIVRPGGSVCWQVGNFVAKDGEVYPLDIVLHPLFARHRATANLRLRNRIVWHFGHGLHCTRRFSGRYESILWFTKGNDYLFSLDAVRVPQKYPGKRAYKGNGRGDYSCNPLGKNPGDVWIVPNVKSGHPEKTGHPCQFPIELPERLLLALTREGDLVVDPFLGVGTTVVAALIHGRRGAGAETSADYLAIARQRVRDAAAGRLRRRPLGQPVYEPTPNTALTTSPFAIESPVT